MKSIYSLFTAVVIATTMTTHGMQRRNSADTISRLRIGTTLPRRMATVATAPEPVAAPFAFNLNWLMAPIEKHPKIALATAGVLATYLVYRYHLYLKTERDFKQNYAADPKKIS